MEGNNRPSAWRRLNQWILPLWVTYALLLLGFAFVISTPLGVGGDWSWYVLAILGAVGVGLFLDRRIYSMTILERSDRGWLIRIERRRYAGRGQRSGWE